MELFTVKAKNAMQKELKAINGLLEVSRSVMNGTVTDKAPDGKYVYVTVKHPCLKGTTEEISETFAEIRGIVDKYASEYRFISNYKIGYARTD